jgi:hypothetical protein
MQTVYDWVSMGLFGALAVLFLHRSTSSGNNNDKIYHYLPPAAGCALLNYLGNNQEYLAADALAVGVVGYIIFLLKPFGQNSN